MKIFKTLTLTLLLLASAASAQQTVQVVWPFGPSSASNYVRHIINKANVDQKKYNFLFIDKPGAGASLAAIYVKKEADNNQLAILATSSSFFIRPLLYKNAGYTFDDFTTLFPIAEVPFALVSRSDSSLEQLMQKPNATMGTVQIGTAWHLMTENFKKSKTDLVIVPYNGPPEITRDIIGGTLDLGLEFISVAQSNNKLRIHGITGRNAIPGHKFLRDIGIKDFENLDFKFLMLAPKTYSSQLIQEFNQIILTASQNNEKLTESYRFDLATPIALDPKNYSNWYNQQIEQTKKFTSTIKAIE